MSYQPVACEMALYNKWQNETLLGHCDSLPEATLSEDKGLFFRSILATLDHILHVDRTLIEYFSTGNLTPFDPNIRPTDGYGAYKTARMAEDAHILALCQNAAPDWFEETIMFHSEMLGRSREIPRWFYAAQMFNHQTHHRSQVTSVLHTMGIAYGNTDMPHNPLSKM